MTKILLVDDDEMSLELLSAALAAEGYDVHTASNGQAALEVLGGEGIRLVISDWEMPGMSGLELCRAVRAKGLLGYTYVILLTARNTQVDLIRGLDAGADDFLSKPFDPDELRVRIRAGERVLALETRDVAIFAMARLAESRDPDTGEHLQRIRHYSRLIVEQLVATGRFPDQVDEEYAHMIYLTSPLHDIGKIGIPDSVLLKPGRLVDSEYQIMKAHAEIGSDTLDAALREFPNVKYLRMARDIARSHHERVDGTGYPDGLVGAAIPLCARIVAVADVYDALTTQRVYKEAFTHTVARNALIEGAGTHFDEQVIAALLERESDWQEIQQRFSDEPARQGPARTGALSPAG